MWSDDCEQAFLDIKSRLTSRPILRLPNYDLPFLMAVDSSDVAIGARLFQDVDGVEHPICYLSKNLNKHQRNYSTVEKKAFGLLFATRALSVYFGSAPVLIYSDHSPLQFLQRMSNYNQKLLRWNTTSRLNIAMGEKHFACSPEPSLLNVLPLQHIPLRGGVCYKWSAGSNYGHIVRVGVFVFYRRPYNLYCVGADVKPCSINQSGVFGFAFFFRLCSQAVYAMPCLPD